MELVDLVNFVIFSNGLTEIVNFPTRIPGCDSNSPALLNLFISSDTSIGSTNISKLSAFAAAWEFCQWDQVGIDVYIPHRKIQVKSNSSSWFSAACAAAIVYRNHYFCLYQQNKSSESIVKFRQASNRSKMVLEAAKLAYATKTKESITSQELGSRDFWRIANSNLNKGKSAIRPLYLRDRRCCLLRLIKQNYLLVTFLRTPILFSLLEIV